jgi:hypothetical protein
MRLGWAERNAQEQCPSEVATTSLPTSPKVAAHDKTACSTPEGDVG